MKLSEITAKLLLAESRVDILKIAQELTALSLQKEETTSSRSAFRHFTKEELQRMPKTFKKEFIANGAVAHIIKRESGKNTFCYEVRYRRNGFNISASSKSLQEAKNKFLDKLIEEMQNAAHGVQSRRSVQNLAQEWFSVKQNSLNPTTYAAYLSYYERYIEPVIGQKDIRNLRTADLLPILEPVKEKGRAYEDVRTILNSVFRYAIANGIITHNPVTLVPFKRAERQNNGALTEKEIYALLNALETPSFNKYKDLFYLQLYAGLRPCEVATARIENGFIVAQNAKRKGGKIEYKRIPIPCGVDINIPDYTSTSAYQNRIFHKIFPDKSQYVLRHTFSTICQQYCRREVVEVWLGDSPERLIGKTYTHFPDEFMRSEMDKVLFPKLFPKTSEK